MAPPMHGISLIFIALGCLIPWHSTQTTVPDHTNVCHGRDSGQERNLLNCNQFFVCKNGNPLLRNCKAGQLYSHVNQRCENSTDALMQQCFHQCPIDPDLIDLPADFQCQQYVRCFQGKPEQRSCADGMLFDSQTGTCNFADRVKCSCPSVDRNQPYFVRDPNNCANFNVCHDGEYKPMICPPGLHFNRVSSQCVAPQEMQCIMLDERNNAVTTTTPPAETTAVVTSATGSYVESTTAAALVTSAPEPISTTEAPFYCPHSWISYEIYPNNCSKFYECSFRESTLRTCPNDWKFDGVTKTCREANSAECFYVVTTSTAAPTSTSTTTPLPFQCPSDKNTSLEPHPFDCSKFVQCTYGVVEVKDCPWNSLFDMNTRLCMEPDMAQCLATTTSTTTAAPAATTPPICKPGVLSVEPHPTDCSQYYSCVYGMTTAKSCTNGQLFDGKIRTCKDANEAQCFVAKEVIAH